MTVFFGEDLLLPVFVLGGALLTGILSCFAYCAPKWGASSLNWKKVGDVAHAVGVANASIFALAVVYFSHSSLFDPIWRSDGFCVSNKDIPYWNSHDLCLYFDTAGALVLGTVYLLLKDRPAMGLATQLVKYNVPGIFAHGLLHGATGKAIRDGIVLDSEAGAAQWNALAELSWAAAPIYVVAPLVTFFWLALLKATMPQVSFPKVIAPLSLAALALQLTVPPQLVSTYTQTVLLLAFGLNQLARPPANKGFPYAAYALIVSVPLGLVGWLETTGCSLGLLALGGHLLYDAYIPLSNLAFLGLCWRAAGCPGPPAAAAAGKKAA